MNNENTDKCYEHLSSEMHLFCETVVMLSADLYEKVYDRQPDFTSACAEIIRLAQKFERELDWDNTEEYKDYLEELEKFESEYLRSIED